MASIIWWTTREESIADHVWTILCEFQGNDWYRCTNINECIVLRSLFVQNRCCCSRFVPFLFGSVDPLRSCVLALLNFLFLMHDFFLYVVVFDFNLCGPTLLGFLVGCTTTFFKSTLSNRSVFESTWLRKHNQSLYFWSINIKSLHEFGSSKSREGGIIFVESQREVFLWWLIAWSIWYRRRGDRVLVFVFFLPLTFKT